jgi:predicted solute-binding protein
MADDEKINEQPQNETPETPETSETPEDRPVFSPEMIIENAEPDINIPEEDLNDYLEKSDEE